MQTYVTSIFLQMCLVDVYLICLCLLMCVCLCLLMCVCLCLVASNELVFVNFYADW